MRNSFSPLLLIKVGPTSHQNEGHRGLREVSLENHCYWSFKNKETIRAKTTSFPRTVRPTKWSQNCSFRSWEITIAHPLLSKLRGRFGRRSGMAVRARRCQWVEENCLLDTTGQSHRGIHSNWDAGRRPEEAPGRPNPSTEREEGQEVPPLAKELSIIDSC